MSPPGPAGPGTASPTWGWATAEYMEWFNTRRLHPAIGGVPPAEYEAAYYTQPQPGSEAGPNN